MLRSIPTIKVWECPLIDSSGAIIRSCAQNYVVQFRLTPSGACLRCFVSFAYDASVSIVQMKVKMEDMAQEFGDMLKETLDRMRERIEVRTTRILLCGDTPRTIPRLLVSTPGKALSAKCSTAIVTAAKAVLFNAYELAPYAAAETVRFLAARRARLFCRLRRCRMQQVNSTGFDVDDSIPLQRRLEEVSLATLAEAPHK